MFKAFPAVIGKIDFSFYSQHLEVKTEPVNEKTNDASVFQEQLKAWTNTVETSTVINYNYAARYNNVVGYPQHPGTLLYIIRNMKYNKRMTTYYIAFARLDTHI